MLKVYPIRTCPQCGAQFQTAQPTRNKQFCSRKCGTSFFSGSQHARYKGGTITAQGYRAICIGGKRITEHRHVMEQHLERKLLSTEIVHHKDGNKLNNDISNLDLVVSIGVHNAMHAETFRSDTHKQCNICMKIKPRSEFSPQQPQSKGVCDPNAAACRKCYNRVRLERKAARRQAN